MQELPERAKRQANKQEMTWEGPLLRVLWKALGIAIALSAPFHASVLAAQQQDLATVAIAFLTQEVETPPKLSNLDPPASHDGAYGGQMAIKDNNTTGRFLKQHFEFREVVVPVDGDIVSSFKSLINAGYRHIVVRLPADQLVGLADLPEASNVLIYNAGAANDSLRNDDCRENVLHTIPSHAMKADALAQYLVWKRWRNWFLVVGQRDGDKLFAAAIKRAAKRFGGKITVEKEWSFGPDTRRTAQREVPVFTQGIEYDVLIVADEIGEFGEYLIYRTWEPKLVAGTQGLVPTSWHRVHEQWGAAQLQSRFLKAFGRNMTETDYSVWAAIRSIGEAAARTQSTDFHEIDAYMRSPEFALAGFKGQKLTYRDWNGQLRQPILVVAPKALVSVSPQEGFLHQVTKLDTLGYDRPESSCRLE